MSAMKSRLLWLEEDKMAMTKEEKKAYQKAYQKAYREANKEKLAAQNKAWRKANKEKLAAQNKAWRKANPEKIAAHSRRYYENGKINSRRNYGTAGKCLEGIGQIVQ
jgi:FtsZ-interacting cell division protein YlmF